MVEKYYLVETEWVGPDPDEHVLEHCFTITTEQPVTNLGRKTLDKPGWLGTTNDWDERYHGEFSSREAAIRHIKKHYPRAVECADDNNEFLVHPEESTEWIDDWMGGGCDQISPETTNAEIKEIGRKIEAEANEDGVYILDDVEDWLLAYRDSLRENYEQDPSDYSDSRTGQSPPAS